MTDGDTPSLLRQRAYAVVAAAIGLVLAVSAMLIGALGLGILVVYALAMSALYMGITAAVLGARRE